MESPLSWRLQIYGPASIIPDPERRQPLTACSTRCERRCRLWSNQSLREWSICGQVRSKGSTGRPEGSSALSPTHTMMVSSGLLKTQRLKELSTASFAERSSGKAEKQRCLLFQMPQPQPRKELARKAALVRGNRRINKRARSSSVGEALKLERERADRTVKIPKKSPCRR